MDRDRVALNAIPPWRRAAIAAVPATAVLVFTVWPLANLTTSVIGRHTLADTLRVPGLARTVWFTVWQAVLSTALTMALGVVPAYLLHRLRFRGRGALRALLVVPFFLPTVVVAAAFTAVLPSGLHGTPAALIAAHMFLNVAVVVQIVGAMWEVIPRDLTGAARTLGAGRVAVARHVVWPVMRPAMLSAATVVFVFCFTSFGAAKLLAGSAHPTLEVEIVRRATQLGDVDGAAFLSIAQVVMLGITIGVSAWIQRRTRLALHGDARPRPTSWRHAAPWVCAAIAALFGIPLVVMAGRSVHGRSGWTLGGWTRFSDTGRRAGLGTVVDVGGALRTSLTYAAWATVITCGVAVLAAVSIHLSRRWGWLLDTGLALPLATSAVTIGLGMLITFDVPPVDWRASAWLLPVGHAMIAIPIAVRSLLGVLGSVPGDRRGAAATLGAGPLRAVWEIEGRALRRPLIGVAGVAATISLGEFGATTVLTRSGRTETMPIVIGRLLGRTGDLPRLQTFALSTILAVLCAAVLAGSWVLARHERGGR